MVYKVEKLQKEGKIRIEVKFSKEEFDNVLKKYESENPQDKLDKAINELITTSYGKVVENDKLQIAGYPNISLSEHVEENFPFAYVAEVDAVPTLTLGKYIGFNIEKEKVSVTELEIAQKIKESLSSKAELKTVEGPLKEGQTAVIDFVGKLNGVAFDGGTGQDYPLEIGSHTFVPGFEEQLVGMNVNETRNIDITFPENYAPALAGKAVVFEVTLHEIKEKELPELTDEVVKQLQIEGVNSVKKYKEYLEKQLFETKSQASNNKAIAEVFKRLKEENPVRIPQYYVDSYVDNQFERVKAQAEQYQIPVETLLQFSGFESVEAFKKQYQEVAVNHLHEQVILREVIMKENFKVSKEELETYIVDLAKQNNMEVEAFKEKYDDSQVVESLLMQKCAEFLIKNNII